MADPLKLIARDADDLHVVAACLQDSLVPLRDMIYLRSERRFVLLVNRFCWERGATEALEERAELATAEPQASPDASFVEAAAGRPRFERVHCGVRFEKVRRVLTRGLRQNERQRPLELLTIGASGNAVELTFAGGAAIRLEVEGILCLIEDVGEPWPTSWQPRHTPEGAEATSE